MSISRNQLKSIVKECLLEILSEGIGGKSGVVAEASSKKTLKQHNSSHQLVAPSQKTVSDKVKFNHSAVNNLKEAIKREAGGNDVMMDILSDTAVNTLPTMLENDRKKMTHLPPTGTAERIVASAEPEQLFGEDAASKWASLAFMDGAKK